MSLTLRETLRETLRFHPCRVTRLISASRDLACARFFATATPVVRRKITTPGSLPLSLSRARAHSLAARVARASYANEKARVFSLAEDKGKEKGKKVGRSLRGKLRGFYFTLTRSPLWRIDDRRC